MKRRFIAGVVLCATIIGSCYWLRSRTIKAVPIQPAKQDAPATRPPVEIGTRNDLPTAQTPEKTNFSPAVTQLLKDRSYPPDISVIKALRVEDKSALIQFYITQERLLDRHPTIYALAYIGDDEVAKLFIETLSKEFSNKKLSDRHEGVLNDERVLFSLVSVLGFLADKSDLAFDFLKKGTDPTFWEKTALWSSSKGPAQPYGILTALSIQAIGKSGRPEAWEILNQLSEHNPIYFDRNGYQRSFHGAIVDAMCYFDISQQYGTEFLKEHLIGNSMRGLRDQWNASENGKKWRLWYLRSKEKK